MKQLRTSYSALRTRLALLLIVLVLAASTASAQDVWTTASANGEVARQAFLKCWRFVHGWLQAADPKSGLIPRNFTESPFWNAKDSAADNYPFMVLTTYFTDRALFEGRMKDMLTTEQRLTNRLDRLPDDFLFATQSFRTPKYKVDDLIFGAAEYVKDGLLPITELLGPSPWSDRMLGLLDDIWKHGTIDTEVGRVPAASHEVAGDLMQGLARTYWMTGNETYREHAFLLADYFLLHHLPTEADKLRLDDHGCEVINGLSEVYYIASKKAPEKHDQWRVPMQKMLDRILEVARDENGLLISLVEPKTGKLLTDDKTDNWGYNYNAFLVVAEADNEPRFRQAVEFVLSNLLNNKDYKWENGGSDGYADSLEGGLNLINRLPIPQAMEWADYVGAILLAKPRDTGVIEGWHGDGNFARTALMYAFWKTQGAYLDPWRADLRIGAAVDPEGYTCFQVEADWPWHGKLRFDVPRHDEFMHMPSDYPRLNQFPQWFTVPAGATFTTPTGTVPADDLRQGIPVSVNKDQPFKIRLKPQA